MSITKTMEACARFAGGEAPKRRFWLAAAVAVALALVAVAGAGVYIHNRRRLGPAAPTVRGRVPEPDRKEWTLLIYMNGNNSLDSFAPENIKAMMKVDRPDANIILQVASLSKKTVTRNQVTLGKSSVLEVLPYAETDMGRVATFSAFLKWGIANFPSHHLCVVVWDHGSGWKPIGSNYKTRDLSLDENTGNALSTKQIGDALRIASVQLGKKVDIFGSDACMMAMVEVACEMQASVDFMVGSEEAEPGRGWIYDAWFTMWGSNPREVAAAIAKTYTDNTRSSTMSVADMRYHWPLMKAMEKLALLMGEHPKEVFAAVGKSYRITDDASFVDIGSFVSNFRPQSPESLAVEAALDDYIAFSVGNDDHIAASGAAVWLPVVPEPKLLAYYKTLCFNSQTNWSGMLQKLWKS